jgi:cell division protein FtsL
MTGALFLFSFLTTMAILYLSEHAAIQRKQLHLTDLERAIRTDEQKAKDLEREIAQLQLSLPVTQFVHARGMVRTGSNLVVVETPQKARL